MDRSRLLKSDLVCLGVLLGLCLAIGVYLIATTVLISKDGVFYIGQAQGFARDPLGVAQRHPPGYPFLLWIAHKAAGAFAGRDSLILWIHASQGVTLLCRLMALIPLYFLGKSLIGGARAFWAVLILIVLPYPAQYGSDVLRDWPYVMFLSFGFWLLYEALQRRLWWMFAFVGLDAGMGYLVQPASAQLVLYGLLALAVVLLSRPRESKFGPLAATVLLVVGFAAAVVPYACATGALIPPQLQRSTFNSAPVITSVGGRGASRDPLDFEVREGEALEIGVEASDAEGDELTFSLAAVAVGSRPVHQFRLAGGDRFVTISEDEKNSLLDMYSPAVREYDGIAYYAYAQADVRASLEPVHRFWSPSRQRHFYTISQSEKDAILAEPAEDAWTYEGIAFYAFAQGRQPPDAVPVRRFWSERAGHSWAVAMPGQNNASVSDSNMADDGVAWYVHVAGELPAGMSMEGRTLRWQPGPGRRGEYGINIVVSDGEMESCQLVKVMVHEGPAVATHLEHAYAGVSVARLSRAVQYTGLGRLPGAVDKLFDGFAESLMVFFLVPWGVGLYYRMRDESDRLERALMAAVIAVNVGLILGRYLWVSPTVERRYCLGMVALTIFYVPVGLERIAGWLSRRAVARDRQQGFPKEHTSPWFVVLAMIGIGICLPKLLTPLYGDKDSYAKAIQWLRENTRAGDVIAVPDNRLAFYAERTGLVYRKEADPRRVDAIVKILDKGAKAAVPAGWSEELSVPINDRRGRTLVIYKTHRRKDP